MEPERAVPLSRQMSRVLASSFLGSTIEFYDFLLYATASAVVFPRVFFAGLDSGLAAFASFATLAAGYAARPLGGVIFGHFGDRTGRKKVLVTSMLVMGTATTLIGLLPSAAQTGAWAAVLLVIVRIVQGVAVGGEWGGAMLIAVEHAPADRRSFAASFATMGAPAGSLLGTGAMTLVSLLPERQFLAWGWRLPFLASVLLVSVGLFVRLRVEESPLFQRLGTSVRQRRIPVAEVLTRHPGKLVLGILVSLSQVIISGMASVWAVNYAVARGAGKTGVLNSATLASLALLLALLVSARLSDRIGGKPIIVAGIIAQVLFVYPMLMLVRSGSLAGFAVAVVIMYTIQGVITGPLGAFLADLFPAAVRFTGASLCFQGSATLGAGLAPLAAVALVDVAGGGISLVGVVWIAVLGVCLLAACLTVASRPRDRAPEREPSPTTLTSDT